MRRGRDLNRAVIGASLVASVAAVFVVRDELRLADAQSALRADISALAGGEAIPPLPISATAGTASPREALVRGLRAAHRAVVAKDAGGRRALFAVADRELAFAAAARPRWGEAEAAQAYLGFLRFGGGDARTHAALESSYADARFIRGAAGFRVRLAAGEWDRLDPQTREAAVDEAVWIERTAIEEGEAIFDVARATGMYGPFMLRWRAMRQRDFQADR